jgi:hypothetical protein
VILKQRGSQMKKDEYLKLLLDTRDAGKRAQKNVGKMETFLKKALPPKDFAKIGKSQLQRLEKLTDKLLIETDQLHELWLKTKISLAVANDFDVFDAGGNVALGREPANALRALLTRLPYRSCRGALGLFLPKFRRS